MKALQLGSIAFAFLCLFNSCTKDSSQVSQNDSNMNAAKSVILGAGNPNTGGNNGQGGGNPTPGNGDVQPTMSIAYSPTITNNPPTATVGTLVTVTGSITSTPAPSCGKLQLQENINGTWLTVKTETVSETNKTVTFSFTPAVTGTYEFQVHYVPGDGGNCSGFAQNMSDVFPLLVVDQCNGLDITGKVDGEPQPVAGTDRYSFKVVYEVTTCGLQFDKLKVQGGLTNGVSNVTAEDGLKRKPGNSTNKIITWEEYTPGVLLPTSKRTYTITFEKAYSGSGTIELTGDWSVSLSLNGTEVGRDSFEKIYYTK